MTAEIGELGVAEYLSLTASAGRGQNNAFLQRAIALLRLARRRDRFGAALCQADRELRRAVRQAIVGSVCAKRPGAST